jgi:hypothetical protein
MDAGAHFNLARAPTSTDFKTDNVFPIEESQLPMSGYRIADFGQLIQFNASTIRENDRERSEFTGASKVSQCPDRLFTAPKFRSPSGAFPLSQAKLAGDIGCTETQ